MSPWYCAYSIYCGHSTVKDIPLFFANGHFRWVPEGRINPTGTFIYHLPHQASHETRKSLLGASIGEPFETLLPDFVLAFAFFSALAYAVLGRRFDRQGRSQAEQEQEVERVIRVVRRRQERRGGES